MKKKLDIEKVKASKTRWNHARRINRGVSAVVARESLDRIAQKHGGKLKPEHVISDAKSSNSDLHPCFEWDDRKAGVEYRLLQAMDLIRSVMIVLDDDTEYAAWVSVNEGKRRVYMTTTSAMANPKIRDSLMDEAMDYIVTFRNRFNRLKEMAPVLAAIETVLRRGVKKAA